MKEKKLLRAWVIYAYITKGKVYSNEIKIFYSQVKKNQFYKLFKENTHYEYYKRRVCCIDTWIYVLYTMKKKKNVIDRCTTYNFWLSAKCWVIVRIQIYAYHVNSIIFFYSRQRIRAEKKNKKKERKYIIRSSVN